MDETLCLLDAITGNACFVGSLNADLMVRTHTIPHPGQTVAGQPLQILPGGKSANQAVCASLLGCHTAMVGALGNDAHADVLKRSLARAQVCTDGIEQVGVPTGTAIITVDESGENTIVISPGANGEVSPALVRHHASYIEQATVLGLCLEIPYESVLEAARIAHGAGRTTVFNYSPLLPVDNELWKLVDVVIVNEHELIEVLTSELSPSNAAGICGTLTQPECVDILDLLQNDPSPLDMHLWQCVRTLLHQKQIDRSVVTLGGAGAVVITPDAITPITPHKVSVVDTTGCGDSFMASIVASLASGLSLEDGARLASYVGAYAATGQGAQNSYGSAETIKSYWFDQEKG